MVTLVIQIESSPSTTKFSWCRRKSSRSMRIQCISRCCCPWCHDTMQLRTVHLYMDGGESGLTSYTWDSGSLHWPVTFRRKVFSSH